MKVTVLAMSAVALVALSQDAEARARGFSLGRSSSAPTRPAAAVPTAPSAAQPSRGVVPVYLGGGRPASPAAAIVAPAAVGIGLGAAASAAGAATKPPAPATAKAPSSCAAENTVGEGAGFCVVN